MVEREYEESTGCGLIQRICRKRPDVLLDPEMLVRTVDTRGLGVRVHRLEPDAELTDLGEIPGLSALADPAHATNVGFGERPAVVPHLQAILGQPAGPLPRAR